MVSLTTLLLTSSLLFTSTTIAKSSTTADKADESTTAAVTEGEVVGIDLGTTYSCAAVWKDGVVQIVANAQGNRITPSWVGFTAEDGKVVGEAAKNQASRNPSNTIFDAKRMIGRSFKDKEVQGELANWPFKVIADGDKPTIRVEANGQKKTLAPEEISAMVLTSMKEAAEAFLDKKIDKAVITVPAYFNDAQRQATKDAGAIAGLKVLRILNEPTAAAMAYGLDKNEKKEQKIVVFDLGGGTFDVSLLAIEDGVYEVKAVNGDTHLGGQDFDTRVVNHLVSVLKTKHNADVKGDDRAMSKLRSEAEKAKKTLSSAVDTQIIMDGFLPGGKDFIYKLSRAKFEELNKDLFQKAIDPVKRALEDASWKKSEIDEVVLVGGSTRIPKVRKMLEDFFNGKSLNHSVNPDEAVAYGAAVQAGVLTGQEKAKDILVIDVTPLSQGIEVVNGYMQKIITRNTLIPVKKSQIFSTAADNQPSVEIAVFEGERVMAKDNHPLDKFRLEGIPLAQRGVPQIEVTFEIDANGILTVSAVDKGTGKKKSINITADRQRLSQEEIDRMIEDAEKFKASDEELKEKIDAKASLENYLYQMKNELADEEGLGKKVDEASKTEILTSISEAMSWMESNAEDATKADYEDKKAEVEKIVAPIITKIYGDQAPPADEAERDEL